MAECGWSDAASAAFGGAASGANRHDVKLLVATLDGRVIARRETDGAHSPHLCLDAAYDADWVRDEAHRRGYQDHIHSRGAEKAEKTLTPGYRARRWVVERTHSWLNRSRRLLVRWEKKTQNYMAFLQLACAQLIFSKILVFG